MTQKKAKRPTAGRARGGKFFSTNSVTKRDKYFGTEKNLIQLRDAPYIRAAHAMGYDTGEDGDGDSPGDEPMLPEYLWAEESWEG